MLAFLADDRNPHLGEIDSSFEIINKRIFSVAERMFKPGRCRVTDKYLTRWCLSAVTNIVNIDHFCLIII